MSLSWENRKKKCRCSYQEETMMLSRETDAIFMKKLKKKKRNIDVVIIRKCNYYGKKWRCHCHFRCCYHEKTAKKKQSMSSAASIRKEPINPFKMLFHHIKCCVCGSYN